MAGIKISDLDELSTADATDSDLLVIVDVSADKTKKIEYRTLLASNIQEAETAKELIVNGTATLTDRVTDNNEPYHVIMSARGDLERSGSLEASGADSCFIDVGRFNYLPDSSALYVSQGIRTAGGNGQLQGIADQALVADSANFDLTSINDVIDNFTGLVTGQVLKWNGSEWANANDNTGDVGQGVIAKLINTKSAGDADASFLVPFVAAVGTDSVEVDNQLTYNPNSNTLTTTTFSGNATTATFATTATTATQSYQLATDSVGATGTYYLITREQRNPGFDSANTSSALTFDASTETLAATNFSGDGSSLNNVAASSATNATNVAITTATNDATFYVHFGNATSGNDGVNVNTSLTYNPADNLLTSNLTYTADSAGLWNGSSPTTVDSAIDRLAFVVKSLNGGVGA